MPSAQIHGLQAGKPSVGELLRRGHQLAPGVQDAGADPGLRPGYKPRRPRHFISLACPDFVGAFHLTCPLFPALSMGYARYRRSRSPAVLPSGVIAFPPFAFPHSRTLSGRQAFGRGAPPPGPPVGTGGSRRGCRPWPAARVRASSSPPFYLACLRALWGALFSFSRRCRHRPLARDRMIRSGRLFHVE